MYVRQLTHWKIVPGIPWLPNISRLLKIKTNNVFKDLILNSPYPPFIDGQSASHYFFFPQFAIENPPSPWIYEQEGHCITKMKNENWPAKPKTKQHLSYLRSIIIYLCLHSKWMNRYLPTQSVKNWTIIRYI